MYLSKGDDIVRECETMLLLNVYAVHYVISECDTYVNITRM